MDGERDVDADAQWAEDELGVRPLASEVRDVIATLQAYGYLEPPRAAAPRLAPGAAIAARLVELELGAPGAVSRPEARVEVEDVELGAAGPVAQAVEHAPAVSTDLADQVGVDVADVRDAVRESEVIRSVYKQGPQPAEPEAAKPAPRPAPEPVQPTPPVRETPRAPSSAKRGGPPLWIVGAAVAASVFLVYKFVLSKDEATTSRSSPLADCCPGR
jgi:hypothetical protein